MRRLREEIDLATFTSELRAALCPVAAAVFSGPCVWGPRSVELYYYRQVNRQQESRPVPTRIPQVVLAPRQRDKVFAPRYICYKNAARLTNGWGSAHAVPQIVVTEHPPNVRHPHHLLPVVPRRHSAPGHITALTPDRVPGTPADPFDRQKLPDIEEAR